MSIVEKTVVKKILKNELTDVSTAAGNIRKEARKNSSKSECMKSSATLEGTESKSRNCPPIVNEYMAISGLDCSTGSPQALKCKKRKLPEIRKQQHTANNIYDSEVLFIPKSEAVSAVNGSSKVKTLGRLDDQGGKGQKMDSNKTRHCSTVLKRLMTHKNGWVFNQPVDPVKLNIPDYFSIISRPMDLGTIKGKLERKLYSTTHQFAADVCLTFANAMQYNPPGNPFHYMAKELHDIFSLRWKELEVNWRKECPMNQSTVSVNRIQKQVVTSKEPQKGSAFSSSSLHRKSLTSAEKLKLSNQLAKLPVEKMPPPLIGFLRRTCSLGPNEKTVDLDINVLDDNTLWNLHQLVRNCLEARFTNSTDVGRKCSQTSLKIVCKGGGGNILRYACDNSKAVTSHTLSKNGSVDNSCSRQNDSTQSSSSDVHSERSTSCMQNSVASSKDYKRPIEGSHRRSLNFDVDGGSAVVDGNNAQPSSHPPSPAVPIGRGEDYPFYEQQLSPSRALRAAWLKSRFADTIVKAQHKTLLNHGAKGDHIKMQQEREKLEKEQQREKARIEAEIKAAEAAAQMRAEAELKVRREMEDAARRRVEAELKAQREMEREAARLVLQKMEQTVHINENGRVFKDLEDLAYARPKDDPEMPDGSLSYFMDELVLQSNQGRNPLEQLGLFIKEDDLDEDDVDEDDLLQPQVGNVNPLEQLGLFVKEDQDKETEHWLSPAEDGEVEEGEVEEGEIL